MFLYQLNGSHSWRISLRRILEGGGPRRISEAGRQDQRLRQALLRLGSDEELPDPEQPHLLLYRRGPDLWPGREAC